ncbi:uncharacterized protein KGF55_004935 [Candida pseudojiufengensis]|uniref:uncharacterized protein n=1 Tax=Candida pseudojiufengensis TaxID=497109 RepID=UPI00222503D4|nr:uncharacterized protein KGF55_004935 [Candida pseudojiufengensis]KAI5960212.1 hypothetical protein KGF55_004935 [Candida pseudojiufengensis]
MTELKQVSFTPDILARIAPDVSLQRHLSIGIRPNLRNFQEFKSIEFSNNVSLKQEKNNIFGSSILKSGSTVIINTISLSLVEELNSNSKEEYTTIYPQIEILRGRSGAPTDEEMIISQDLFEVFKKVKIIPYESLKVKNLGVAIKDEETGKEEIIYPDLQQEQFQYISNSSNLNKIYSYVIHINIKIYSREISTNSIFDLCFLSILKSLQELHLPRIYLDDSINTKISIKSRKSNLRSMISSSKPILNFDLRSEYKFKLDLNVDPNTISSNFGVIKKETTKSFTDEDEMEIDDEQDRDEEEDEDEEDEEKQNQTILLTDLEGEAEESSILSRISIINNPKKLNKISLINNSNGDITLDILKQAIEISKNRAIHMNESL